MRPKLLMTASSLGHITSFHLPYIKAFHDRGWEVHAAGAGEAEIPCADEVISLGFEKSFSSPANFRAASRLRELMRRNKYELIICHTSLAAFFTRLAATGIKGESRIINVVHGYLFDEETPKLKAAVLKAAEHLTAPQTDLVLTMNDWDLDWARSNRVASKVSYIPGMGIDAGRMAGIHEARAFSFEEEAFVLVYPAEFSKRKNQALLIRAMALLPERVKLILPGRGAKLEECRALAEGLGLGRRVIFPGYVSDIFSVLKYADAAVSSSHSEGLPFNIMEAMFAGLPVIASDVKGNSDLVQEGENGFLFPYDDERAFAAAVMHLLEEPGLCSEMGRAGRSYAQKYELGAVLPQVMDTYMSVLDI